jgi:serine/threonine protein phosphatase PrpC
VDVDVRLGEGTCVWARKVPRGAARRRRVGVYGRAYPGEPASGDDAAFVRTGDSLLACVADGLGHGAPARDAAARAVRMAFAQSWRAPAALLAACDPALTRTRGAVMAAVHVDAVGEAVAAGVGNVSLHGYGYGGSWRFGGSSFVLGSPGGARRIAEETHRLGPYDALVLFSDGVRSRLDLSGQLDLLREHPVVVAEHVVDQFGRDDDDVLVMVVS